MDIRILGPLEVADGDRVAALGGAKPRALLAVLVLHLNEVVTRDRLIEEIWSGAAPATAVKSVQVYVSALRRALPTPEPVLLTRSGGYVLELGPEAVDARRFERAVEAGRRALQDDQCARAADTLRDGLALWRGPPLVDFSYQPFAQAEIARLEELRLAALEARIDADLRLGRHAALTGELEALVTVHPARERLAGLLMIALYRNGRQADALDVYQRARAHLDSEFGLEPAPELRALQLAVLQQSLPRPPGRESDLEVVAGTATGAGEPTPAPATGAGVRDLPGPLWLTSAFPFVGRSSELATLRTMMSSAEGDGRRMVLVGGEAGAGKSRLVREFAAEVAAGGDLVLYGACDAVVHAPYGPFVEALEHLVRVLDAKALRAALGTTGGELARLLPDLATRVAELPAPLEADPDTERHRLHTAVTDVLAGVSRQRPVLLVLEDAHWADGPTLVLLRHLARAAGRARLLVVATFRDTGAEVRDALAETLADLRRSDGVLRLRLAGLSGEAVSEFVRRAAGGEEDSRVAELARGISDLTEGHAFLVCELWRALVDTEVVDVADGIVRSRRPLTELGTPEGIREVVSQRLGRLEPGTRGLLQLAATAGAEFELELVSRAAIAGQWELSDALEEAVSSGMIEELPSRRLAYRFTHELYRRALYDGLSATRRAELHLRVGETLERAGGPSGRGVADLAHHFAAAAPLVGAARGVEYNVRAARAASAALAFDEAAERLGVALELGIESPAERAGVLLELGTANHRAGRAVEALRAFAASAGIARELGDAELFAHAAIGYEEACGRPAILDPVAVELLEQAAAALGQSAPQLRVRLLGGLARTLGIRGEHERGAIVRANAVAMARGLSDRAVLGTLLVRSYWARGTHSLEEILAMLTEARDIAEELGHAELLNEAMAWRVTTFVALGDVDSARREVAGLRATAEQTAQPISLTTAEHSGSAIALLDGRLAEAEAMARRSRDYSRLLTGADASGIYGIQMFGIRREQGRLAELAPMVTILAREASWRAGLASLLAELGMEAQASRELALIADEGLDTLRASLWLASLTYLTDACAALGEERIAALVYPELEPLAGTNVMVGHVVACYGAADRHLGMLAATLGDWERAEAHFERALELNRRMGAQTWLAHTGYEYARMLLRRGRADRPRVAALLDESDGLAERIGMPALLGRIRGLRAPRATPKRADALSPRELRILGLVAKGSSNREIGATLSISEHTAANHIRAILRKTHCANRTEAASYAHRHGLAEQ